MKTETVVLGSDFLRDPHTINARLREQGPVHQVLMSTGLKVWLVTRYEEGRALLADPRLSKNLVDAAHLFERHQTDMSRQRDYSHIVNKSLVNLDPPDHTRLRRLIVKAFTTRQVTRLRPRIEQIADELLDPLADRPEFDLVAEFATPLVSMVISELLGIPEGERAEFWARAAVLSSDDGRDATTEASNALIAQASQIVDAKRDNLGADLLSSLIQVAEGTDRLTHEEIVSFAVLLFAAGVETTANLICIGMLTLLRDPGQLAVLRADPSLLPNAVEEFMRFEGSLNISHWRRTTDPVRIGDVTIPADEFVFIGITSANRDAARFAEPDRLNVTRDASGHLAFGHGIHYCIGAPLARVESEIAFRRLLAHFPSLTLAVDPAELTWRPSTMQHRGLRALPLRPAPR